MSILTGLGYLTLRPVPVAPDNASPQAYKLP